VLAIDGSFGEGGGQIVRSALALSLVTGRPCSIHNIRAGRKKPGLMRQHLTAVAAAAQIGGAEAEGAAIGSRRLSFTPGPVRPGTYRFDVGTAGSTSLVLQTILPALLTADGPSELTLEGGTHNSLAPPADFLAKTYLPIVGRLGPAVEATIDRHGFYPAGGGQVRVRVRPAPRLGGLDLTERGPLVGKRVRALVAQLPRHIAQRECHTIAQQSGWDESCCRVEEVAGSRGPGNVVMIELDFQWLTEVFTAFGRLGVRAEQVAAEAWQAASRYLESGAPVGEHLADQLLLPLGIAAASDGAASRFRTLALSSHATTHIELLRQFLDVEIRVEPLGPDECLVHIGARG